jgi:hypothetical protein
MSELRCSLMTNYKSVKILFDLDDPYQLKLYEHLKARTNGSSYVRSLIHKEVGNSMFPRTELPDGDAGTKGGANDSAQSSTNVISTEHSNIKIHINNSEIAEEDMFVQDLI